MKHVIVDLPHASDNINGIDFVEHDAKGHNGRTRKITKDPVEDHIAEHFGSIPGYTVVEPKKAKAKADKASNADLLNPPAGDGAGESDGEGEGAPDNDDTGAAGDKE